MFQMSTGDLIVGLIVGLVVCAVFVVVVLIIAKKDGAKLEDLLAKVPDDKKELLKAEEYQPLDASGIKCATKGLIADIATDGEKAKLEILFYNKPRQEFYNQQAKIRDAELNGKGYKLYDFVPCQMKFDKEMQIHEFKKLM